MTKYVTLPYNKKLNLLRSHSIGCHWPNLDQEQWCLHCRKQFNGHSVRVWQSQDGSLWLVCGTPGCDGSPIDWAPFPYWDPQNPETRRQLKKKTEHPRKNRPDKQGGEANNDVPY